LLIRRLRVDVYVKLPAGPSAAVEVCSFEETYNILICLRVMSKFGHGDGAANLFVLFGFT